MADSIRHHFYFRRYTIALAIMELRMTHLQINQPLV
uniref:Uncharacterized protein n=1 Tax=Anguilla anguilla TaxID=7936 RepID=A0A0E9UVU1_ANGAN